MAGGFGNTLAPVEAAAIGLIPYALKDKTTFIRNAALLGAVMCMYSQKARQNICRIAGEAEEIPLTENPIFDRLLVSRMAFKPY